MTKHRLSIISVVALVGVAASVVIQQQSKLREENRLLRQQLEHLAPLRAENERLSNQLGQANKAQTLPSAQLSELLKLRGEVASLRRQSNELGTLRNDNQRLRSSQLTFKPGAQTALTQEGLPKESWAFLGYADPESAFQSAVWAMSQGDAKVFRTSLAPEANMFLWRNPSDIDYGDYGSDIDLSRMIKAESEKVAAFKIIDQEAISEDAAILTVMTAGTNEVRRFNLQRIGDDWKLAGPLKQTAAPGTK